MLTTQTVCTSYIKLTSVFHNWENEQHIYINMNLKHALRILALREESEEDIFGDNPFLLVNNSHGSGFPASSASDLSHSAVASSASYVQNPAKTQQWRAHILASRFLTWGFNIWVSPTYKQPAAFSTHKHNKSACYNICFMSGWTQGATKQTNPKPFYSFYKNGSKSKVKGCWDTSNNQTKITNRKPHYGED